MTEFEHAQIDNEFQNAVLQCRELIRPIINGEIERGHCVGGRECYGAARGLRKTTLKDAVKIAKTVEVIINRAVNKFLDDKK